MKKELNEYRLNVVGDSETVLFESNSDAEASRWVNGYTRYDWGGYQCLSIIGLDANDGASYVIATKSKTDGWEDGE